MLGSCEATRGPTILAMGSTDRRRALACASVLLVACRAAPEPSPTQPPPTPAPAPAPVPVVTSEPTPTPLPPLTWPDVQALLPETQAYVPSSRAEPPPWLAEASTLWLRVGESCLPITGSKPLSPAEPRTYVLEECHERSRKLDVRCEREVVLGETFDENGIESCAATLPSGAGFARGSAFGAIDPPPGWSLVTAGDDQLRYAITWDLWVEAERLVWVEDTCTPESVAALTEALAAEGLDDHALREALFYRHGVLDHDRRCMEHHGVHLFTRRSGARHIGDRGATTRTEPGVHDCTIPCPETTQELRRINAVLAIQPYALATDTATILVHRTKEGCEANPAGGLPAFTESPCRGEWIDEGLRHARKRR